MGAVLADKPFRGVTCLDHIPAFENHGGDADVQLGMGVLLDNVQPFAVFLFLFRKSCGEGVIIILDSRRRRLVRRHGTKFTPTYVRDTFMLCVPRLIYLRPNY